MPPFNPIQFVRRMVNGRAQLAGNRVQLEDELGASITAANPLDVAGTIEQGAAGIDPWVVTDNWTPVLRSDEGDNDSDKSFAVGADTEEQVLWIWVELTSTATVGNRQITVEIQDGSNDVIGRWKAGTTQAASLTRNYCFAPGNADLTSFRDTTYLMTPIPPALILPASYIVRVYDSAAVAAAADDMVVQMMVARRSV